MMKLSFIIPVYNCKAYLPACVESIRTVGAEDYEILLIDDGSTDGSGAVCDELADRFPEIRVIHRSNGGASAARNRGLQEAAGEKILFLDADDGIDADALREVLADPRCALADLTVFGLTFDYYYNGRCYRRDPLCHNYDGVMDQSVWGGDFEGLYRDNSLSPVWNKVFSREILVQNGLKLNEDMFLYEDFEFVLRYLCHCDTIWNVPRAIYHYRQSEDEGNAGRRLKRVDSIPEFLKPIESAMAHLLAANPAVARRDMDSILQQLYLCLAREKIAVSGIGEIRRVCREFGSWCGGRSLPVEASAFQRRLAEEKAAALWLANKKTALRHWIAVRVKMLLKCG